MEVTVKRKQKVYRSMESTQKKSAVASAPPDTNSISISSPHERVVREDVEAEEFESAAANSRFKDRSEEQKRSVQPALPTEEEAPSLVTPESSTETEPPSTGSPETLHEKIVTEIPLAAAATTEKESGKQAERSTASAASSTYAALTPQAQQAAATAAAVVPSLATATHAPTEVAMGTPTETKTALFSRLVSPSVETKGEPLALI